MLCCYSIRLSYRMHAILWLRTPAIRQENGKAKKKKKRKSKKKSDEEPAEPAEPVEPEDHLRSMVARIKVFDAFCKYIVPLKMSRRQENGDASEDGEVCTSCAFLLHHFTRFEPGSRGRDLRPRFAFSKIVFFDLFTSVQGEE